MTPHSATPVANSREAILEATERLILRDGIDGIRAKSLADEAGLSIAAPYHYFESLDAVVEATYLRFHASADPKREAALRAAGDDPISQLHAVLAADFDCGDDDPRSTWLLRLEFQRRAIFDARLQRSVRDGEQAVLDRLARIVRVGQRTGAIPTTVEAPMIAARLLSLSCGLGTLLLVELITPADAVELLAAAIDDRADWRHAISDPVVPSASPSRDPQPSRSTEILDTTIALIADAGVAGVHFNAVAERAGCSLTLPRYYFPTIRKLVDAAFARDLEIAQARLGVMLDAESTPLDRLAHIYVPRDSAQLAARRSTFVMWVEYLGLGEHDPVARASASARLQGFIDFSWALGRDLADAGVVSADRATLVRAKRLVAVNTGAAGLWLLGVLTDGEFAAVMNGTIDDEVALGG
ncbi:MAG: TetR/AcrR family transcriptional regulator [Gaiellales bacterium]